MCVNHTTNCYLGLLHVNAFRNAWEMLPREYIDDTIITRLFQKTVARDGPFQFILVHFHCPNPWLAGEYRPSSSRVRVSEWAGSSFVGEPTNSACRYICNTYNKGYTFRLHRAVNTSHSSQGVICMYCVINKKGVINFRSLNSVQYELACTSVAQYSTSSYN